MSKIFRYSLLLLSLYLLTSCTIYTSSDRKKFETENATISTTENFAIDLNSLQAVSCGQDSLSQKSEASKLVNILTDENNQSVFLWQHIVDGFSYLETDNLNGAYCIYE